jgi:cellulose synthase/poly-beta-1,6-N-acetylglucosamine synthase-like glycosyltransferase
MARIRPAKQFAVEAASHDWVLCVDADERVSPDLREQIVSETKAPRGFCLLDTPPQPFSGAMAPGTARVIRMERALVPPRARALG